MIDITIKKDQQTKKKLLFSDSKANNEIKNPEPSPINNIPFHSATILFNNVTDISINLNHSVEQLYDYCIKRKYTKIVTYKKMTLITCKLKEILPDQ